MSATVPCMAKTEVPTSRVRSANHRPVRGDGQWVLYWMTAFRRTEFNFALQYARDWARQLQRPLLVLEALRCDYPWASQRLHRFLIQGMQDNARACNAAGVAYWPYVEPAHHAGRGLLQRLAESACLVVSDDFPCFFLPAMYARLADRLPCRFQLVDANGLMPLSVAERTFTVAPYRRWMQAELPDQLADSPEPRPLSRAGLKGIPAGAELPKTVRQQWPAADLERLLAANGLQRLPLDPRVRPVAERGGAVEAQRKLRHFIQQRLDRYDHERNEPDLSGSTELSPYLHFGHLSSHQLFWAIMEHQRWNPSCLSRPNGSTHGFWGVSPAAEALLDQLCTWREIGFNMCWREPNYADYESLPAWARQTLHEHRHDRRPHLYALDQFEAAQTHDPLWNAAQRQLLSEGRIHNYLRMLWGKKILHWTESPEQALDVMIQLNNQYALDGRNPNSYSGIFWVLGRYDRAWGPEREVFGKIRYMTSENTARKHAVKRYLEKYSQL